LAAAVSKLANATALGESLSLRIAELSDYQSRAYAGRYADQVEAVIERERAAVGAVAGQVSASFAAGLFKLMAYKDEYEVARLHLDSIEAARRDEEFGPGAEVAVMLHPPALRAMGLKRK